MTEMTLGEAADILALGGWACACTGPLPGRQPGDLRCNCQVMMAEVRALQRGAHIAARQLTDYAATREATEMGA